MYCHECGKQNPDSAKFCAFCGTKMLVPVPTYEPERAPDLAQAPLQKEPEPTAPKPVMTESNLAAKPAPAKPDPHSAYRRPADDAASVRPLVDNPAQPLRGGASRPNPQPRPAPKPTMPVRPPASKAVTSTGDSLTPPARTPNVKKPRYGDVTHRKPQPSPFKQAQQRMSAMLPSKKPEHDEEDDLFFEDIDTGDFDTEGEDRLTKRLKSIVAILFLVLVVSIGVWLFGSQGGQVFRASMGMGASADAYRILGDQATSNGELQRAAEAYHSALKLDPDNFQYALETGKAYQRLGNDERAIEAFNMCIALRDTAPEPYRLLAEVLEQQGSDAAGEQVRQKGYEMTGDATLLKEQEQPVQPVG